MSYMIAHDWDILGDERIPRWPSKIGEKRLLRVEITTWVGTTATDAKHYSVVVSEEANQWWCEDKTAWVELTCDHHQADYRLDATVLSEKEAVEVAKMFVELITKDRGDYYEVRWRGNVEGIEALKAQYEEAGAA